jgi:DNA repair and recombination protein RAD52
MKRALMTFGNPFGLALYDKTQSNVVAGEPEPDSRALYFEAAEKKIAEYKDPAALTTWWMSDEQKQARRFANLDQADVDALKNKVIARRNELSKVAA